MEVQLSTLWLPVVAGLAALLNLLKSFTIAKGNQIILLERRWFGRQMPDGRTVALRNEVGVQARVLGPGFQTFALCNRGLFIPFTCSASLRWF